MGLLSRHWPMLTGETDPETKEPRRLAPEAVLHVIREEVIALRKQGLLGRPVRFDPVTDFYLLAWDAFRAVTFPADETRKLALAPGVDSGSSVVRQHRVLGKRGDAVTLQEPREAAPERGSTRRPTRSTRYWEPPTRPCSSFRRTAPGRRSAFWTATA
jgi:putative DNA methylase